MLAQKHIKVGDQKYVIQQLPATEGMEVMITLAKILKGASKGFSDEYMLNVSETHINAGQLVAGIIDAMDIKGTPQFIQKLVTDSVVKPEFGPDEYNAQFSGNYTDMFELVAEILEHNNFMDLVKKNLLPPIMGLFSTLGIETASTP